jgi:hypothetical protein
MTAQQFIEAMTADVPVYPIASWRNLPKGWRYWGPWRGADGEAALAEYRSKHDRMPPVIYRTDSGEFYVVHDQQGDVAPDPLVLP